MAVKTKDQEIFEKPVKLSPRARQFLEKEFKPKYKRFLKAAKKIMLVILVWGPSASTSSSYGRRLYRKRLKIRNALRKRGFCAVFSEELKAKGNKEESLKSIEYAQAEAADLVVVIESSPGSLAEVHDFADKAVNYKMLVFVDESVKTGYPYQGALRDLNDAYDNVKTFKYPEDIAECHLLTQVVKKAEALRRLAYYNESSDYRKDLKAIGRF